MGWQEDLQQLELERSSGQVSEADYYRRRDELLAFGASQPGVNPAENFSQSTTFPQQAYSGLGSYPGGVSGLDLSGPNTGGLSTGPTMTTNAFQPTDQYPVGPTWTGSAGTPPNPGGFYGTGPTVIESANAPASRPKRAKQDWIKAGLAMVILAGFIILAVFWLSGRFGQNSTAAPATTSQASPSSTASADDPLIAAYLPGEAQPGITNKVKNWADVPPLGFLSASEVTAFTSGKPTDAHLGMTRDGYDTIRVLVVHVQNADAAKHVRDQLSTISLSPGQRRADAQAGVIAFANDSVKNSSNDQTQILRMAYYASGEYVVRIDVLGSDLLNVQQEFGVVLASQLRALTADS